MRVGFLVSGLWGGSGLLLVGCCLVVSAGVKFWMWCWSCGGGGGGGAGNMW